jgi:starch synthase
MRKTKKVLIVSPEEFPRLKVGGLGMMVNGCRKGLKENGVEVEVVSPESSIYQPLARKGTEDLYRKLGWEAAEVNRSFGADWLWVQDFGGVWAAESFLKEQTAKVLWTIHSPVGDNYNYAYSYGYESNEENIDWGDSFFEFGSLIKSGIRLADKVSTVSKSFARRLERHQLFEGVKEIGWVNNGIDFERWNANNDNLIGKKLVGDWGKFKKENKRILQKRMGLGEEDWPVFCFVSRIVDQKGVGLLLEVLPKILAREKCQWVMVGGGERKLTEKIRKLEGKFKGKLAARLEPDFELPHQVFAGADYLVLPSRTEPFGIVVAEARKYGVAPIVHLVDGLRDQVRDGVNGLGFWNYQKNELEAKLIEAIGAFRSQWQERQWHNGKMVSGWGEAAKDWLRLMNEG